MILGNRADTGAPLAIDLDRLIETRLFVTANSGGGKSWLLRRLLEQTHGKVQHIVIDVEGEFASLREKYDYVLAAAKGGDCVANPQSASLLARRLLELEVSAIIDIYDLLPYERCAFAQRFLDSMMNAPKDLWHPCLVVIDEAHRLCPEEGKTVSTDSVIHLMSQGRKRGFAGVISTQRCAKLHKDAIAEANNYLVGRTTLDVDQKRVAPTLGLAARDAVKLRELEDGNFYTFGPAISRDVLTVHVGPITTTHPKAGGKGKRKALPPPPASVKVKKVLGALADLPAEAEAEGKTVASLDAEIKRLKSQLVNVIGRSPTLDDAAVAEIGRKAYQRGRAEGGHIAKAAEEVIKKIVIDVRCVKDTVDRAMVDLHARTAAHATGPRRRHRGLRTHLCQHRRRSRRS